MRKHNKTSYVIILLLIISGIIYYNGSIYIPVYQDGDFFFAEWIFRESYKGSIIGNPDFDPSFIEVTKDTFVDNYLLSAESLGYNHTIIAVEPQTDSHFKTAFLIEDNFYIDYDEGFFIMNAEAYKTDLDQFREVFHTIVLTLDPEASDGEIEHFKNLDRPIEFLDYEMLYLSAKVDFRFYDEDNHYEVHVEDLRMGH